MKNTSNLLHFSYGTAAALLALTVSTNAFATKPCGDFGECKVLVEINSSDGDIGFHFLMDGDDLNSAMLHDPDGNLVFEDAASGALLDQKLSHRFGPALRQTAIVLLSTGCVGMARDFEAKMADYWPQER